MTMQDLSDVESYFLSRAKTMWGDIVNKISFTFEVSDLPKVYAHLLLPSKPRVYGDRIYSAPNHMTLRVKPKFFDLDFDKQLKILIHEAGHIGYPNHSKEFERIVEKNGGIVTISMMEGNGVRLEGQKHKGERFQLIKKFKTREEAEDYVKTNLYGKGLYNAVRTHY